MVDYTEKEEEFYNKKIINVMNYFGECIDILKRLEIDINESKYTHCQYELFKREILWFYPDEQDNEDTKSIEEKGVTQEEFNKVIRIIDEIGEKYGI